VSQRTRQIKPKFPPFRPSDNQTNVFFSGQNHPLSNLFCCPVFVEDRWFRSNEQFIQWSKARIYHDSLAELKILQTSDSHKIREIGKTVRGFKTNPSLWYSRAPAIVHKCNMAKYSSSPSLRAILFATDGCFLAESTVDTIWGIGVRHNDCKRMSAKEWTGSNLAGKILTNVREALLGKYPKQQPASGTNEVTGVAPGVGAGKVALLGDSHVNGVCGTDALGNVPGLKCYSRRGGRIEDATTYIESRGGEPPAHIILHVGVNNVSRNQPPEYVATTFAPLFQLMGAKAPNSKLTVIGLPLVTNYTLNQNIKQTNKILSVVCNLFGVAFHCTNSLFHEDGKFCRDMHAKDGYHLSQKGYGKLASVVKSLINPN
jgi:ribA/ribD-fused uncharacterized protein